MGCTDRALTAPGGAGLLTMDDDAIRHAIQRARALTEDQPEPYRSLAFRVVLEALLRAPTGDATTAGRATPSPVGLELVEFLAAKKAETHPDRVVVIAYYYYHTQNGAGVTTKELADAYARARVKRPQNFPDVIASCVRRGYLVEGGRKDGMKCWVITRTGEAHVEQDL
ncbi:MAG: hypothetical protein C4290_13585 [Chloroflexota bacterium]